ncbi:MerR family transcriptional regulator [Rathayibacter sp. CAU 1779]
MTTYRIGEVAAQVGVETHVLRHWEDVGVLVPRRTGTGQRVYDHESITRARIIRRCQRAGLSLAQIRALAPAESADRAALINEQRCVVQETISRLLMADAYLDHLTQCRHPLADECPECSAFARST